MLGKWGAAVAIVVTASIAAVVPEAEAGVCRLSCEPGESRNARGCCIAKGGASHSRGKAKAKRTRARPKPSESGNIRVEADVPKALIFIDGEKQRNKTPTLLRNVAAGRHRVQVVKNGATWDVKVTVLVGEQVNVDAVLAEEVMFVEAEDMYQKQLVPFRLPRRLRQLEAAFRNLTALVQQTADKYGRLDNAKRLDLRVAAMVRRGEIYVEMARKLFEAPMPAEIARRGPDVEDQYLMALDEYGNRYEQQAVFAWKKALEIAKQAGVRSRWTRLAREHLSQYVPEEYPIYFLGLVDTVDEPSERYRVAKTQPSDALRDARDSLSVNPHDVEARVQMGLAYIAMANYDAAENALDAALKNPDSAKNAELFFAYGLVYDATEREVLAAKSFARCHELAPAHRGCAVNYGAALLTAQRYEKAVALYEPLAVKGAIPAIWSNLGNSYLQLAAERTGAEKLALVGKARRAYERAQAAHRGHRASLNNLGLLYLDVRDIEDDKGHKLEPMARLDKAAEYFAKYEKVAGSDARLESHKRRLDKQRKQEEKRQERMQKLREREAKRKAEQDEAK